MGFVKAFGFSLLAFIGLNFLFVIITNTISDNLNLLFSQITANPLVLILILFGPVVYFPGEIFQILVGEIMLSLRPEVLIEFIGYIVSPFVASLVAGRMGENKGGSIGGWFLTAIISAVGLAILAFLYPLLFPPSIETAIILLLLSGITIGIFYGCFALLFTKTEYY